MEYHSIPKVAGVLNSKNKSIKVCILAVLKITRLEAK